MELTNYLDDHYQTICEGMLTNFTPTSDTLVIACAGMIGQMGGLPAFEFLQTLSAYQVKTIFLRDTYQIWYQRGIREIGTIDQTTTYLHQLIAEQAPRRLVVIGASTGGYAALLYGALLSAQHVVAFSPLSLLKLPERMLNGDFRSFKMLYHRTRRNPRWLIQLPWFLGLRRSTYPDLKPAMREATRTQFQLHYSNNKVDTFQATRLRGLGHVHLHGYPYERHNLVYYLKEQGLLKGILDAAFNDT